MAHRVTRPAPAYTDTLYSFTICYTIIDAKTAGLKPYNEYQSWHNFEDFKDICDIWMNFYIDKQN